MKKCICGMIALLVLLAAAVPAYAVPGWQYQPDIGQEAGNSGTAAEGSIWGYIANATEEGLVDVDMDGEYDFNIVGVELLDVSVPLRVSTAAVYSGAIQEFYSGIGVIRNNSKATRAKISLISFEKKADDVSPITLAPWDSALTADEIAMKLVSAASEQAFEADVTTVGEAAPLDMGVLRPRRTMEYMLDGQFDPGLVLAHPGEVVEYTCVFKFETVE